MTEGQNTRRGGVEATPENIEAWALKRGLPERGSGLPIYPEERPILRFWVAICGVPNASTAMLPTSELAAAWHDLTGETLRRLKGN